MDLYDIPKQVGRQNVKRLGRGHGSGNGKTSGRGHNGAKSRSGYSRKTGFEGGQMPLYLRLPKRGFNKNTKIKNRHSIINIGKIEKLNVEKVNNRVLIDSGLIRKNTKSLKVLGKRDLSRSVTVYANFFSNNARQKIESNNGKVEVVT